MSAERPTPTTSDQHRADIIAGLRAMADFLEARPDIPEPDSLREQYSVIDRYDRQTSRVVESTDDEKLAEVRRIAALLGVEAQVHGGGSSVRAEYPIAAETVYIVHARLTGGEQR